MKVARAIRNDLRYLPSTMRIPFPGDLLLATALLLSFAIPASARAQEPSPAPTAAETAGVKATLPPAPPAAPAPAADCGPCAQRSAKPPKDELVETPILVPSAVPTGFLIAWKPCIAAVRVNAGARETFGSDKVQPLRALVRYTHLFDERSPFAGRLEIEGGRFQTDSESAYAGSDGADVTLRALGGAATRVSQNWNILGSIGAITRYQWGKPSGGVPTIGVFGVVANSELEFKVSPSISVIFMGEVALTPFPYLAQKDLGDLADGSEVKGRIQLSVDLTRGLAVDVGFELTRWHASFSRLTILDALNPDHALLIEARDYQLTFGARWKNR